jgi:hypothetical protein
MKTNLHSHSSLTTKPDYTNPVLLQNQVLAFPRQQHVLVFVRRTSINTSPTFETQVPNVLMLHSYHEIKL